MKGLLYTSFEVRKGKDWDCFMPINDWRFQCFLTLELILNLEFCVFLEERDYADDFGMSRSLVEKPLHPLDKVPWTCEILQ